MKSEQSIIIKIDKIFNKNFEEIDTLEFSRIFNTNG